MIKSQILNPLKHLLILVLLCSSLLCTKVTGQVPNFDTSKFIRIPASDKYTKSISYQKKWGRNYRAEWRTPVTFRKAYLDTLAGGLIPYELGGGRQSTSLQLKDANDRQYVLRSIDKSYGKALPPIAQGTFIEALANDQVTSGHPYSALTIPPMAEAAKIFHTKPAIYFIPSQKALGAFNDKIGDALFLFEQRPDENWQTAPNFGNSENIVSTEKMLENLYEDNDVKLDQLLFVRSRLFDMFIGDWGRHEDQWRWAEFKNNGKKIYRPIPRDRDQAYTRFEGRLTKVALALAGAKHMKTFAHDIKDVTTFNFPARNMDYHLTNEVTLEQWVGIAKELQSLLTDKVIDDAILQLPPEVYNISGPEIATKLKSRRRLLPTFAEEYFLFITKEVEITGTLDRELFEVKRLSDIETEVNVYKITKEGKTTDTPYFHRIFDNRETKEIRIYGLDNEDKYVVTGNVNSGINIRLIGGPAKDNYQNQSVVKKGSRKTFIYDNSKNEIKRSHETSLKLSSDTAIHDFKYASFGYNKRSTRPLIFFSNEDRIYVSLAHIIQKHKWRKEPYGSRQSIDVKYSISQAAFSTTYKGRFVEVLGKWDANLLANYDAIRWTNFFGLGNHTPLTTDDDDFNRARTREFIVSAGVERTINNRHRFTIAPFYQTIKVIPDTDRFVSKYITPDAFENYSTHSFAGAGAAYVFQHLNDSILPTKGLGITVGAVHTSEINKQAVQTYHGRINLYFPVSKTISLSISGGGSTLTGTPHFYQYNTIGGNRSLRGYPRDRFYGNSTVYNQNEIHFIRDVRSYIFNGKAGIFGLFDIGRVWLDNEKSNKWHTGAGGGIILSPFNKISFSAAYALSEEDNNFHFSILKVL